LTSVRFPSWLLRAALEETIRFGPEAERSASNRLADRARWVPGMVRIAALRRADAAVAAAETLARRVQAGTATQSEIVRELRHRFPWLGDTESATPVDLATRLASYGYYLVIM
jgi:hypothetical protein